MVRVIDFLCLVDIFLDHVVELFVHLVDVLVVELLQVLDLLG